MEINYFWLMIGAKNVKRVRTFTGIFSEERTQDTALGCTSHGRVIKSIDKGRDAQDVGEKNKFLAKVSASVADAGQKLDCRHPFLGGQAKQFK